MAKEFNYRGVGPEKLATLSTEDFMKLAPSRVRRSLKRGLLPSQKALLTRIKKAKAKGDQKPIRTQCRNIPIIPEMIGVTLMVYNGKEYIIVSIDAEKVGHFLGEFVLTRKRIQHSAPGVGATRSSKFIPLK